MHHLKFIGLSLVGFIFFLVPFEISGESKIMISHIVGFVYTHMIDAFVHMTIIAAWLVFILTLVFIKYQAKSTWLNDVFKTTPIQATLRVFGAFLYLMIMNQWFSQFNFTQMILDPNTGGLMAGEGGLLTTLYITFLVGILALPLLTHFGLVEFAGTLLGPIVYKVFRVPGYSTIDAIASFVGDGTIGIVVTDQQYQRGYYNRREAYVIATSFSVVGIAFAASVAEELGFSHIFPIFYGTIILITIVLAFITSRMPLKKFPTTYYKNATKKRMDTQKEGGLLLHSYITATTQAKKASFQKAFLESCKNVLHIYVGFLPIIMAVGTTSLIIAEYTNVFTIISIPFIYVYQWLGFGTDIAEMMAPATLAGFADMYLPALFITNSPSEVSRFFIGVLSFTQLVFMSETGIILVKSKIGLSFLDVLKVFIFRTLLSLPLLVVITYVLVWLNILTV